MLFKCIHIIYFHVFVCFQERAQDIQEQLLTLHRSSSPDIQAQVITQLTPPSSNKKGNTSVSEEKENKNKNNDTSPDIEYEHETVK